MHYVSFDDIQPSRYALSFVLSVNIRDDFMAVAFVALDSEKLGGEHVNGNYHHDFGDNMFPHYLGNKKIKDIFDEEDVNEEYNEDIIIASQDMASLAKYIPKSVLLFLISE